VIERRPMDEAPRDGRIVVAEEAKTGRLVYAVWRDGAWRLRDDPAIEPELAHYIAVR
jgi:hypothetical protein